MDVELSDMTVTLYDRLDFHRATTVTKAVAFIEQEDPAIRPAEVLATLSEFYVLMGVESWTLGYPVTAANIRAHLLTHAEVGLVVEAADALYQEQILLPLLARARNSSPPSQTDASTSRTPRGAKRPRKHSQPSSISTIQTDATVTSSSRLDGDSSFLPKSESAA